MNNKGKNTDSKPVNNKQKKKNNNSDGKNKETQTKGNQNILKNQGIDEKKEIFREVEINLSNTEYNKNQAKKKKKKKKHKILKIILLIFLIAIITFAAIFIKRWKSNGWTFGGFVATILGHDTNTLANLPRINILLIGQSQNLTDTILVCSYDPKIQEASMLSIPRDTFVGRNKNYATGSDKINALYQISPEKLLSKVNEITGLDIKYYMKVDTQSLRELVDSVGGIYFDVPMDMNYDDSSQNLHIHLKAGYQLLDGSKAEQVVRFRHNNDGSSYPIEYGDQDLGRMKTQRAFITEVIKQLAKPENITKVDDYIKIANNNLESNFSLWNLKDYVPYIIDFNTDNIKTATLPGTSDKINSLWFYVYNKKETEKLINDMFKTELSKEQEKNAQTKISILNGTDDDSKLENLRSLLKESGYTIVSTGNTTKTKTTAIINRSNKTSDEATELQEIVGIGVLSSSNDGDSDVDYTIIIGEDY